MATAAAYTKRQPRAHRRTRYTRTRRAPRLSPVRFYALLTWSAFVIYVLSETVVTVAGR